MENREDQRIGSVTAGSAVIQTAKHRKSLANAPVLEERRGLSADMLSNFETGLRARRLRECPSSRLSHKTSRIDLV